MSFSQNLSNRLASALGSRKAAVEFETTYDVATNGAAVASKALVLDSSKGISGITNVGTEKLTLSAGGYIDLDSATATLSSNAATVTKYAVQVTSEALTTAAGAAQAFAITLAGVAATDLAFVTGAGGTNTREHIAYKAICTANTVTVTLNNIGPTNAVNGTVIFNLIVMKA